MTDETRLVTKPTLVERRRKECLRCGRTGDHISLHDCVEALGSTNEGMSLRIIADYLERVRKGWPTGKRSKEGQKLQEATTLLHDVARAIVGDDD